MAMKIVDNLIIDVPDSDVRLNRRLRSSRAISDSITTNYYTNDDLEKHNEIKEWFYNFNDNNEYYIDVDKTLIYTSLIKEIVLPLSNEFHENLDGLRSDITLFESLNLNSKTLIPKLELTGANNRYLKFDNENEIVSKFRNLICGRITRIIFKKKRNKFYIWLELHENYKNYLDIDSLNINQIDLSENVIDGYNKIYYGTPGCGKSYKVQQKYETNDNEVFRTTFYPDYSNSDFIGQILPTLTDDDQISYKFSPGVFSNALLTAYKNPNKRIVLIIEEINRGNASAIFGDIFQLLDRNNIGKSMYHVNIPLLEEWLNENGTTKDSIYIPSNMHIIATLNTNDQNVFTLDTAFKRRWNMESVANDFTANLDWFNYYIPGSNYTWKNFVEQINDFILNNNYMNISNEDKRIGVFFIDDNYLTETPLEYDKNKAKEFAYKVLMYLWEDVAKVNRSDWFNTNIRSLDELINEFIEEKDDDSLSIFNFINDNNESNY